MLNGDLLIHSKQLYNCKWYKRLYYKIYNFWQLLNIFNKPYITIYLCFKGDEPSSMFYAPYIPIIVDSNNNLPDRESLEPRSIIDENSRYLY